MAIKKPNYSIPDLTFKIVHAFQKAKHKIRLLSCSKFRYLFDALEKSLLLAARHTEGNLLQAKTLVIKTCFFEMSFIVRV